MDRKLAIEVTKFRVSAISQLSDLALLTFKQKCLAYKKAPHWDDEH